MNQPSNPNRPPDPNQPRSGGQPLAPQQPPHSYQPYQPPVQPPPGYAQPGQYPPQPFAPVPMPRPVPFYHQVWFVVIMLFLFLPVGLVLLWTSPVTKMSGRIVWTALIALGLVMGITAGGDKEAAPSGSTPVATKQAPAKKEPQWNTQELDAGENGNIAVAVEVLKGVSAADLTQNADDQASAADAFKAPWKFYGKPVAFTGEVIIAQAYPPGSEVSDVFGGGEITELVFMTEDGTIVDYALQGDSGKINVGSWITAYGYVVGQVEAENKLGGMTTQMMMIGKVIKEAE